MTQQMQTAASQPQRSSGLMLTIAWMVVLIPALWGVSQTFYKSLALFTSPPPANVSGK